jgi:hypothetical protein
MTAVYKFEVLVVDHDNVGPASCMAEIENARYGNRCISPHIMSVEEREVEWSDEHPLNHRGKADAEFRRLFPLTPKEAP